MAGDVVAAPGGFCRNCGVALTDAGRMIWQGVPHCGDCIEKLQGAVAAGRVAADFSGVTLDVEQPIEGPQSPQRPQQRRHDREADGLADAPSPLLAFLLGFVPGLGAVYNGQYIKGLIHVMLFGTLLTLGFHEGDALVPLLVPLLAFLVFYQPFEAMRTARQIRRGEEVEEFSGIAGLIFGGSPGVVGSVVWIALGVVFLLHTLGIWTLDDVLPFSPVLLIGLGAYRLFRSIVLEREREELAAISVEAETQDLV